MINVIKSKRLRAEARVHLAVFKNDPDTLDLLVEGMLDVVHNMKPADEEAGSVMLEQKCREYVAVFGAQLAQMTARPVPRTPGRLHFTHADSKRANTLVRQCIATVGTLATLLLLGVGCGACSGSGEPQAVVTFAGVACVDTHDDGSTVAHTLHLGLHSDVPTMYRLEVTGDGASYLLPAREIDGDEALKARVDTGAPHAWRDISVRVSTPRGEEWIVTDDVGTLARCAP